MHFRHSGPARYWVALLCLCGLALSLGQASQAAPPPSITITTNTTILPSDTKTIDGKNVTVSGCVVTIDGPHSINSLTITNAGVVTHDPPGSSNLNGANAGLNLVIATNCTINTGCAISAVGTGFAGGSGSLLAQGPGAGTSDSTGNNDGGGGSYGGEGFAGYGGAAAGPVYDDLTLKMPTDLGSGGGSGSGGTSAGGNGGGAIQLTVNGTLQVNGKIVADGASGPSSTIARTGGAGSGGSIFLIVNSLQGTGLISANGGSGTIGYGNAAESFGAGSGGRIAIYYTTNGFATPLTTSGYKISTMGGSGYIYNKTGPSLGPVHAGSGTIFVKQTAQTQGDLWIHNAGTGENAFTPLQDPFTFDNIYIWGQGVLAPPIGSPLTLTVLSTLNIGIDGIISATGRGFAGGIGTMSAQGPGAGTSDSVGNSDGGGGSYGGEGLASYGGAAAGPVYDDLTLKMPTDLGSGGGSGSGGTSAGGNGGGAIQLTVNGTLQVNGKLLADGASGPPSGLNRTSGAGSGGSIYLVVNSIQGGGLISASGGAGTIGYGNSSESLGAGGGGRIAIYYTTNGFATPLTTSGYKIRASGGTGFIYNQSGPSIGPFHAGAGTVFMKQAAQTQGDLWIHDAGTGENAFTPLQDPFTFDNIYIWGQGVLAPPIGSPLTLTVLGTLDVALSGYISATGRGFFGGSDAAPAQGPGAGASGGATIGGAGGSYGGLGINGNSSTPAGPTYGTAALPNQPGSGGGSGNNGQSRGGNGGGVIQLIVNGTLQVDGDVAANGASAANVATSGGGGSGGSINVTANTLQGVGTIHAGGGASPQGPGGGGGGRVAIYAAINNLSKSNIHVSGGTGTGLQAGAGTIYLQGTPGVLLRTLNIPISTVAESQQTTGTLSISGPAPTGGITIPLTSSNLAAATVQPSVTIASGMTSTTFTVTTNALASAASTKIAAQLGGVVLSAPVNVQPWIAGLALNPAIVPGGIASTGTVSLNFPAPTNGLAVNLTSGNSSIVTVSGPVTVPAGATSMTFPITTSNTVTYQTPVPIKATYGPEATSSTLIVDPANTALKAFSLLPSTIVGGNYTIATLSITAKAPIGGATIALSSANPGLVSVPALITIPQGKSIVSFLIATPPVSALQSVGITATLGTQSSTATLNITPATIASFQLVPNNVIGGQETALGMVTLQSAVQSTTVITITSNNSLAIPDTTVVIPAGQTTGIFDIDTAANTTGKPISATITVTANGSTQTATLTIN